MRSNLIKYLKDILLPSYDESSIFLLNFVFILLFAFNRTCRTEIFSFYRRPTGGDSRGYVYAILIALMFIGGVSASIYHIFAKGEKGELAETLMKFSAMLLTGVAGLACGLYLLKNDINWLIFSPAINVVMGVILLYQIGFIEDVHFDQKDSSFLQIFLGLLACIGLIIYFNFYHKYYWAITFSLCVNYVINCNHFISRFPNYLKNRVIVSQGLK